MNTESVDKKLQRYRIKFYKILIIKGLLILFSSISSIWILGSLFEYYLYLPSTLKIAIIISIVLSAFYLMATKVLLPFYFLFSKRHGLSKQKMAVSIGNYFPQISDKLLNFIQLSEHSKENVLVQASLDQQSQLFQNISFVAAIDYKTNLKYLQYALFPIGFIALLYFYKPGILVDGSDRLIQYNQKFQPAAPFTFQVLNNTMSGFLNEDFELNVQLDGAALPESAYILENGRRIKMTKSGLGTYLYTFQKLHENKTFKIAAAGFESENYEITVHKRPNLGSFMVSLTYPAHTNLGFKRLENIGNLNIPEGTHVQWDFNTRNTDSLALRFAGENARSNAKILDNQVFTYQKRVYKNLNYEIEINNAYANNKDKIAYQIKTITDEYPSIELNTFQDTTLFQFIIVGGNIADDYGITALSIVYEKLNKGISSGKTEIPLKINKKQTSQGFYHQWSMDSVALKTNETLQYYLKVTDNDGVNGRKSTLSPIRQFNIPDAEAIQQQIVEGEKNAEKNIEETIQKAKDLKSQIKKVENRLKGKKELSWQDEKLLEDLVKKKEALNKTLEELQKEYNSLTEKQNRFDKKPEDIQEQMEQIQELMDEMLDEKTKQMYEELQQLLEENKDIEQIQDLLNNLDNKENNLEKELERTLELFKRLKFDQKLQETIDKLNELAEEQNSLSEQTKDKNNDKEQLKEEQSEIEKEFNEVKEKLEELEKLNDELKAPNNLDNQEKEQKQIKESIQESKDQLEKNNRKKASEQQKDAGKKMKEMAKKMQQMQSTMQMEQMQENMENLRNIMHNLITLSFNQEKLMVEFKEVDQSDPRFIQLSQDQIKLRDDAQIIEDSLISLSTRVFQIASFVTREVSNMNNFMEQSSVSIKERKKGIATGKQQQAMTSMNNLALMLDDTMDQMQQQMAEAMGMSSGKKQGGDPSLSKMQEQLNKKIEDLKKSGKGGRQLSEELAKLAAEQEQIRKLLQEMDKKLEQMNNGTKPGNHGDLLQKMEDTELDLVNKRITKETIERQKQIMTRLLESEKAFREKELDQKRKGETAKSQYNYQLPKEFEEYFKLKEKEIELYKTVPPKLLPFYKKEVNDYFKRIGEN